MSDLSIGLYLNRPNFRPFHGPNGHQSILHIALHSPSVSLMDTLTLGLILLLFATSLS